MGLTKAAHGPPLQILLSLVSQGDLGSLHGYTLAQGQEHSSPVADALMFLDASELSLALNNQESHPPAHSALRILQPGLGVCTRNDGPSGDSEHHLCPGTISGSPLSGTRLPAYRGLTML